ncbi:MAG: TMEM175 family protein [Myxococcota bacterium]
MTKEALGAFIDAVYAIAITILALEIPDELGGEVSVRIFGEMLVEYVIAFAILFSFWVHHRRINAALETPTRGTLALSAIIMMLACLMPRATSLVFDYGGVVNMGVATTTVSVPQGSVGIATLVDRLYVTVALAADLMLLALAIVVSRRAAPDCKPPPKYISSAMLLVGLVCAALHPRESRYFTLVIPIALFFESDVATLLERLRGRS